MPIQQKDIKILWDRSGNRCAICRTELTQAASAVTASFTLNEQPHIVGDKPRSARSNMPFEDLLFRTKVLEFTNEEKARMPDLLYNNFDVPDPQPTSDQDIAT